MLGAEDLGLYAVALKIAMLAGLVVTAFQTAWGPFSLSIHKQNDASLTYNWVLKIFSVGICITVLLITMLSGPLINLLASNRYSGAVVVVFPLLLGLAVQATSWIT
jgi:O-antigen/teichoic acid export membrane protein